MINTVIPRSWLIDAVGSRELSIDPRQFSSSSPSLFFTNSVVLQCLREDLLSEYGISLLFKISIDTQMTVDLGQIVSGTTVTGSPYQLGYSCC